MTASVKPTLTQPSASKRSTPLSALGPGTLILANGSIVPVLPPTPLIPQNPTVITNPTPFLLNQQTVVVVTTNSISQITVPPKTTQAVGSKNVSFVNRGLACIKPKRCTTKTVQANKVPIPALTSRYANSCVVLSNNQSTVTKSQQQQKEQQKKSNEQQDKQGKVNEKQNSGKVASETLKRKFEGETKVVKQQKTDESNEKSKQLDTNTANSKFTTSEVNSEENKADQKKVSTLYSIDSICKKSDRKNDNYQQKEVKEYPTNTRAELRNEAQNVVQSDLQNSTNREASPQVTTATTVSVIPAINSVIDALPRTSSTRKIDEIPENVLKEIENSQNNKNDKHGVSESKELEINLQHSELSNDIFASLQVQSGGQNPESTSPTAAFLLAFPLVSTLTGVKVSEVIEEENSDSQRGTPTLLQIGTMDTTKTTQTNADNLTPSLLNLDNFSFFSSKDICSSFYQPFDNFIPTTTVATTTTEKGGDKKKIALDNNTDKNNKITFEIPVTKEATLPVFVSSDNFINKTDTRQQKLNQPFNNCNQVNTSTSEGNNKIVNINNKPVITQASHIIQQQHSNNNNNLTATYNTYNTNYTPNVSAYNTINHPDRKHSTQNQKSKCSTMNSYNMHTTRSSQTVAQCNTFNPFAETVKYTSSVCCYNTVSKPYIESLYSNSSTYNYNCQPDVSFSQGNYISQKNNQKTEEKNYYNMNINYNNSTYNTDTRNNSAFSNNYCQMPNVNNKDKFNTQSNKNKPSSNQTRPPVNWMTTPDIRHQTTATNNDYFLPCFGKDLDNIQSSIGTFCVTTTNTQTTYFNTNNSTIYPTPELTYSLPDVKKNLDSTFPSVPISTFQRSDMDENQFTWSPTKFPQLLDPSHAFVSTALPTLVGDLALGTTSVPYSDQKLDSLNKNKDSYNRQKDVRRNKPSNYDNHVNFLSVSQLVDHNKGETMSARTTSRRNSGNRSNKPIVSQKSGKRNHKDGKDNQNYQSVPCNKTSDKTHMKQAQSNTYNIQQNNQDWIGEASKQHHQVKNPSNSYSAEALIGHQPLSEDIGMKQRNNSVQGHCGYSTSNSLPVSFLTDNIVPYFPPVELPQDTNFIQNQNCQNNSFSHNFPSASIQSNTYSSTSLITCTPSITTNYLSTTNFMSEIGTHDYNPIIPDNLNLFSHTSGNRSENKTCMKSANALHKQVNRSEERKSTDAAVCGSNNNFSKKSKKKTVNESNVPGFVDFSFLSMPAAINSPILPDDFHANLLAPTTSQLYPCKNPLYPKQNIDLNAGAALLPLPPVPVSRSNIQHPEISPSANNVGTSLTNFNVSTIFPDINKVNI